MTLRDYQKAALDKAKAAVAKGAVAPLIVSPTGTGKTRIAVAACAGHVELGGQPIFITPRRELADQARRSLAREGVLCPVRTIQEITTAGASVPPATMVVLDEARHYLADAWGRVRELFPEAIFLGLDATPERGDGLGLGALYDALIEAISVKDAIAQGHLVPCEVIRPERSLGPGELAMDPVDAYFQHAPGTFAVVFAPTVEIAIQYAIAFRERGVAAASVFGNMGDQARADRLAEYERGEVKVLCNAQLLTEGWDAPHTETVILARGFQTPGSYLQACGRGLRPAPKKERCTVLDLRGVSHLHGEPDDERTWHLEGKAARRAKDDLDLRFCPVCGAVVLAGSPCEQCGHAGAMRMRKPRVLGLPMQRFAREHAMPDEQAAKALAQLLRVAAMKGYRRGWAERVFAHKYGRKVTPELMRLARSG